MALEFKKAVSTQIPQIWTILEHAIARRKADGSQQWQDGYPNIEVITKDISQNAGYVLMENQDIIGYVAVMINNEPEYDNIKGKWLTTSDFVVFHRIAIGSTYLGKGFSKTILAFIEEFALQNNISSIKADTNFDNLAMLSLFKKLDYTYCGEVYFRGSARRAYEKVLSKNA